MTKDANGWMPIETAPTDGTPILAYFANGVICAGVYIYVEGYCPDSFEPDEDGWIDYGECDWECFVLTDPNTSKPNMDFEYGTPSHWMPLPQPPETP